jgi:hypothetical protein
MGDFFGEGIRVGHAKFKMLGGHAVGQPSGGGEVIHKNDRAIITPACAGNFGALQCAQVAFYRRLNRREYPKLCVWSLVHASFTGHLLNRSGYRIANWLRAATHPLTHLPVFSNLRIAR